MTQKYKNYNVYYNEYRLDNPSSLKSQLELLKEGQEKIAQDVHKIIEFLQIPPDTTSNRQLVKIQSIIKSKSNTDDLSTVKSKPSMDDSSKYITVRSKK